MTAICPAAPLAAALLDVSFIDLPVGTNLVRFHDPLYPGNSFNPNVGKEMEDASQGARLARFRKRPV
jgi:hypothetical protein